MPYIIKMPSSRPHFMLGDLSDWESKTSLELRVDVSKIFKDGSRELSTEEVPVKLVLNKVSKVREAFKSVGGIFVVSERLKAMIESLDPGMHQFFPISLFWKSGDPIHGRWHILNVHAHQSSIIDEKSKVKPGVAFEGLNAPVMYLSSTPPEVTLSGVKLSALNLWREERYPSLMFVSDEFVRMIEDEEIQFFPYYRVGIE